MNMIDFPRVGVDGITRTKREIEIWYVNDVLKGSILHNIDSISGIVSGSLEEKIRDYLKTNLERILILRPTEIGRWTSIIDERYKTVFKKKVRKHFELSDFSKEIGKAFDYTSYRKTTLVELAKRLNVKTCLYCNMQYTLYAEEENTPRGKINGLAKMQFDHFFDKSDYPMFSMSLYNLIPSCSVCNQGKSKIKLSLEYHPYLSSIAEKFFFSIKNPIELYGGSMAMDIVDLDLIPNASFNRSAFEDYIACFHLEALYSRHGDIAREVFDKAYESPYYCNPLFFDSLLSEMTEYLKRLWLGTYTNKDDIWRRPMTKFMQDLWQQARYVDDEKD